MKKSIAETQKKLAIQKAVLAKETKDVTNLENSSLQSFFQILIGQYDNKLEKEKQEMVEAKLKYDQLKLQLTELHQEIQRYENYEEELKVLKVKFHEQSELKIKELRRNDVSFRNQYDSLLVSINKKKHEQVEIHEAKKAGSNLIIVLKRAQEAFKSASNWGTYDLLGGGMFSSLVKQSRIDEGKDILNETGLYLDKFKRELQDVEYIFNIDIEISSFLSFADSFLDGIFVDMAVQNKINKTKDKIDSAIRDVNQLLKDLEQKNNEIEEAIIRQENDLEKILISL